MTSGKRNVLTWLLRGAAFVVVVTAAGCSGGSRDVYNTTDQQGIDADASATAFPALQAGEKAPTVNIFGELDGVPRPAPKRGGEAGFQQHTFVEEGFDGDVAVDPKGQTMVFSSTRHSEHADIYLQKVDGLSVTQLTSDDADDAFPVFSPDGQHIAFCSTRGGNWDIYVMDVNGRNVVQVTSSPMQELHPSFSPDGTRLVYSAMSSRSGQWELWTANLQNGERRMIGFGLFPVWSPSKDGDRIAYQKARARGSRWFSLWTIKLIDGEGTSATEVAVSANAAIVSPTWSPDGKMLAFATIVEPAITDHGRPSGQQDIWTVSADGTNRHRITDGNGICATPFWASDNRIYFVSDRGGSECIWSARAADSSNIATAGVEAGELAH
jgi:Tol biopolymer transport system component